MRIRSQRRRPSYWTGSDARPSAPLQPVSHPVQTSNRRYKRSGRDPGDGESISAVAQAAAGPTPHRSIFLRHQIVDRKRWFRRRRSRKVPRRARPHRRNPAQRLCSVTARGRRSSGNKSRSPAARSLHFPKTIRSHAQRSRTVERV
jgi:hypothetical protein